MTLPQLEWSAMSMHERSLDVLLRNIEAHRGRWRFAFTPKDVYINTGKERPYDYVDLNDIRIKEVLERHSGNNTADKRRNEHNIRFATIPVADFTLNDNLATLLHYLAKLGIKDVALVTPEEHYATRISKVSTDKLNDFLSRHGITNNIVMLPNVGWGSELEPTQSPQIFCGEGSRRWECKYKKWIPDASAMPREDRAEPQYKQVAKATEIVLPNTNQSIDIVINNRIQQASKNIIKKTVTPSLQDAATSSANNRDMAGAESAVEDNELELEITATVTAAAAVDAETALSVAPIASVSGREASATMSASYGMSQECFGNAGPNTKWLTRNRAIAYAREYYMNINPAHSAYTLVGIEQKREQEETAAKQMLKIEIIINRILGPYSIEYIQPKEYGDQVSLEHKYPTTLSASMCRLIAQQPDMFSSGISQSSLPQNVYYDRKYNGYYPSTVGRANASPYTVKSLANTASNNDTKSWLPYAVTDERSARIFNSPPTPTNQGQYSKLNLSKAEEIASLIQGEQQKAEAALQTLFPHTPPSGIDSALKLLLIERGPAALESLIDIAAELQNCDPYMPALCAHTGIGDIGYMLSADFEEQMLEYSVARAKLLEYDTVKVLFEGDDGEKSSQINEPASQVRAHRRTLFMNSMKKHLMQSSPQLIFSSVLATHAFYNDISTTLSELGMNDKEQEEMLVLISQKLDILGPERLPSGDTLRPCIPVVLERTALMLQRYIHSRDVNGFKKMVDNLPLLRTGYDGLERLYPAIAEQTWHKDWAEIKEAYDRHNTAIAPIPNPSFNLSDESLAQLTKCDKQTVHKAMGILFKDRPDQEIALTMAALVSQSQASDIAKMFEAVVEIEEQHKFPLSELMKTIRSADMSTLALNEAMMTKEHAKKAEGILREAHPMGQLIFSCVTSMLPLIKHMDLGEREDIRTYQAMSAAFGMASGLEDIQRVCLRMGVMSTDNFILMLNILSKKALSLIEEGHNGTQGTSHPIHYYSLHNAFTRFAETDLRYIREQYMRETTRMQREIAGHSNAQNTARANEDLYDDLAKRATAELLKAAENLNLDKVLTEQEAESAARLAVNARDLDCGSDFNTFALDAPIDILSGSVFFDLIMDNQISIVGKQQRYDLMCLVQHPPLQRYSTDFTRYPDLAVRDGTFCKSISGTKKEQPPRYRQGTGNMTPAAPTTGNIIDALKHLIYGREEKTIHIPEHIKENPLLHNRLAVEEAIKNNEKPGAWITAMPWIMHARREYIAGYNRALGPGNREQLTRALKMLQDDVSMLGQFHDYIINCTKAQLDRVRTQGQDKYPVIAALNAMHASAYTSWPNTFLKNYRDTGEWIEVDQYPSAVVKEYDGILEVLAARCMTRAGATAPQSVIANNSLCPNPGDIGKAMPQDFFAIMPERLLMAMGNTVATANRAACRSMLRKISVAMQMSVVANSMLPQGHPDSVPNILEDTYAAVDLLERWIRKQSNNPAGKCDVNWVHAMAALLGMAVPSTKPTRTSSQYTPHTTTVLFISAVEKSLAINSKKEFYGKSAGTLIEITRAKGDLSDVSEAVESLTKDIGSLKHDLSNHKIYLEHAKYSLERIKQQKDREYAAGEREIHGVASMAHYDKDIKQKTKELNSLKKQVGPHKKDIGLEIQMLGLKNDIESIKREKGRAITTRRHQKDHNGMPPAITKYESELAAAQTAYDNNVRIEQQIANKIKNAEESLSDNQAKVKSYEENIKKLTAQCEQEGHQYLETVARPAINLFRIIGGYAPCSTPYTYDSKDVISAPADIAEAERNLMVASDAVADCTGYIINLMSTLADYKYHLEGAGGDLERIEQGKSATDKMGEMEISSVQEIARHGKDIEQKTKELNSLKKQVNPNKRNKDLKSKISELEYAIYTTKNLKAQALAIQEHQENHNGEPPAITKYKTELAEAQQVYDRHNRAAQSMLEKIKASEEALSSAQLNVEECKRQLAELIEQHGQENSRYLKTTAEPAVRAASSKDVISAPPDVSLINITESLNLLSKGGGRGNQLSVAEADQLVKGCSYQLADAINSDDQSQEKLKEGAGIVDERLRQALGQDEALSSSTSTPEPCASIYQYLRPPHAETDQVGAAAASAANAAPNPYTSMFLAIVQINDTRDADELCNIINDMPSTLISVFRDVVSRMSSPAQGQNTYATFTLKTLRLLVDKLTSQPVTMTANEEQAQKDNALRFQTALRSVAPEKYDEMLADYIASLQIYNEPGESPAPEPIKRLQTKIVEQFIPTHEPKKAEATVTKTRITVLKGEVQKQLERDRSVLEPGIVAPIIDLLQPPLFDKKDDASLLSWAAAAKNIKAVDIVNQMFGSDKGAQLPFSQYSHNILPMQQRQAVAAIVRGATPKSLINTTNPSQTYNAILDLLAIDCFHYTPNNTFMVLSACQSLIAVLARFNSATPYNHDTIAAIKAIKQSLTTDNNKTGDADYYNDLAGALAILRGAALPPTYPKDLQGLKKLVANVNLRDPNCRELVVPAIARNHSLTLDAAKLSKFAMLCADDSSNEYQAAIEQMIGNISAYNGDAPIAALVDLNAELASDANINYVAGLTQLQPGTGSGTPLSTTAAVKAQKQCLRVIAAACSEAMPEHLGMIMPNIIKPEMFMLPPLVQSENPNDWLAMPRTDISTLIDSMGMLIKEGIININDSNEVDKAVEYAKKAIGGKVVRASELCAYASMAHVGGPEYAKCIKAVIMGDGWQDLSLNNATRAWHNTHRQVFKCSAAEYARLIDKIRIKNKEGRLVPLPFSQRELLLRAAHTLDQYLIDNQRIEVADGHLLSLGEMDNNQLRTTLHNIRNSGRNDTISKIQKIALIAEAQARATDHKLRPAQRLCVLLPSIIEDANLIEEMPTGAGKGAICLARAIGYWADATNNTVNLTTANITLATRDYNYGRPVLELLGVPYAHGVITKDTRHLHGELGGVNYYTYDGLALNGALSKLGEDMLGDNEWETKREMAYDTISIIDEYDAASGSTVNFKVAQPAPFLGLANLGYQKLFCQIIYDYVSTHDAPAQDERKTDEAQGSSPRPTKKSLVVGFIEHMRKELDTIKQATATDAQTKTRQIILGKVISTLDESPETSALTLVQYMRAVHHVKRMQPNVNFITRPSVKLPGQYQIVPMSNGRPDPNLKYSNGVQQMLAIELANRDRISGERESAMYEFAPNSQTLVQYTPLDLVKRHIPTAEHKKNRFLGVTGTFGESSALAREAGEHGALVYEMPQDSQRVCKDKEPIFVRNKEEQLNKLLDVINNERLQRPKVIFCDTASDAQDVAAFLSNANISYRMCDLVSEHAINEHDAVATAGDKSQITIFTKASGRGSDFSTEHNYGFMLISLCTGITDNMRGQIIGRIGRAGQSGVTQEIVNIEEISKGIGVDVDIIDAGQRLNYWQECRDNLSRAAINKQIENRLIDEATSLISDMGLFVKDFKKAIELNQFMDVMRTKITAYNSYDNQKAFVLTEVGKKYGASLRDSLEARLNAIPQMAEVELGESTVVATQTDDNTTQLIVSTAKPNVADIAPYPEPIPHAVKASVAMTSMGNSVRLYIDRTEHVAGSLLDLLSGQPNAKQQELEEASRVCLVGIQHARYLIQEMNAMKQLAENKNIGYDFAPQLGLCVDNICRVMHGYLDTFRSPSANVSLKDPFMTMCWRQIDYCKSMHAAILLKAKHSPETLMSEVPDYHSRVMQSITATFTAAIHKNIGEAAFEMLMHEALEEVRSSKSRQVHKAIVDNMRDRAMTAALSNTNVQQAINAFVESYKANQQNNLTQKIGQAISSKRIIVTTDKEQLAIANAAKIANYSIDKPEFLGSEWINSVAMKYAVHTIAQTITPEAVMGIIASELDAIEDDKWFGSNALPDNSEQASEDVAATGTSQPSIMELITANAQQQINDLIEQIPQKICANIGNDGAQVFAEEQKIRDQQVDSIIKGAADMAASRALLRQNTENAVVARAKALAASEAFLKALEGSAYKLAHDHSAKLSIYVAEAIRDSLPKKVPASQFNSYIAEVQERITEIKDSMLTMDRVFNALVEEARSRIARASGHSDIMGIVLEEDVRIAIKGDISQITSREEAGNAVEQLTANKLRRRIGAAADAAIEYSNMASLSDTVLDEIWRPEGKSAALADINGMINTLRERSRDMELAHFKQVANEQLDKYLEHDIYMSEPLIREGKHGIYILFEVITFIGRKLVHAICHAWPISNSRADVASELKQLANESRVKEFVERALAIAEQDSTKKGMHRTGKSRLATVIVRLVEVIPEDDAVGPGKISALAETWLPLMKAEHRAVPTDTPERAAVPTLELSTDSMISNAIKQKGQPAALSTNWLDSLEEYSDSESSYSALYDPKEDRARSVIEESTATIKGAMSAEPGVPLEKRKYSGPAIIEYLRTKDQVPKMLSHGKVNTKLEASSASDHIQLKQGLEPRPTRPSHGKE